MEKATFAAGPARYARATLAGGCFWCTEVIFKRIKGVEKVISGYSGGNIENPTYTKVSFGTTGHAEASQIFFDPKIISYKDLLYIFFRVHDPTTPNRQGADIGSQYRSMIFYHNEKQKKQALFSKKEVEKEGIYKNPIVTDIAPLKAFYPAEDYHQDYYEKNPEKLYCKLVIDPKLKKLRKEFQKYLK